MRVLVRVRVRVCVLERERERERESERETDRHTDRQTDRQTETDIKKDRQTTGYIFLAHWIKISEILPWDRKSYLTYAIIHRTSSNVIM